MGGPVSDTKELLRGVSASARESYYRTSTSRYVYYAIIIFLLLAIAVIGLMEGGFLGIVVAVGGSLGIALVSIWLYIH